MKTLEIVWCKSQRWPGFSPLVVLKLEPGGPSSRPQTGAQTSEKEIDFETAPRHFENYYKTQPKNCVMKVFQISTKQGRPDQALS